MKKNFTLLAGAGLVILAMVSCTKRDEFVGSWQALNPTDISSQLPASANATSLMSVTFGPNTDGQGGDVFISSIISATQSLDETPGVVSPYEVSVAATATINGKWAYESDDDYDLILVLDQNSLNVNVDKDGVTFRENDLTGNQVPASDSLTVATANLWKGQIISAMRKDLSRYNRIDDVDVKNSKSLGKILKFEIDNPDQVLTFRNVE